MKSMAEPMNAKTHYCNRLSTLEKLVLYTSHRLNNALSVLKLESESINNQSVNNQLNLICDMVQLLQRFTHLSYVRSGSFQLNDYVATAVQLSQLLLQHEAQIDVACQFQPGLGDVSGNPERLQQAVIDVICYCASTTSDEKNELFVKTYHKDKFNIVDIGYRKANRYVEIKDARITEQHFDGRYNRFLIKMPII